ncbi:MAG: MFS transporter [Myxococcales bacterium]|nr:MFS transporter [Myxococcales bacterium]
MRRPSLGAIFLTIFLDLLGFGLVLPFLGEQARDSFGSTEFVGALLASVYSLAQFVFVPVWGRLSDRIGRRPVLIWSVAATAAGMSFLGLALALHLGLWALFAARVFGGIATANLGTASAYIADITKPEERAKGMGMIGMAFGLGFILGPGIGGALAHVKVNGYEGAVPCFVAAALSVVNLGWVVFGLAESLPPEKRSEKRRSLAPFDVQSAREAFGRPGVAACILVNFLVLLSFTNLDQTFRYFTKDHFGMNAMMTGGVLAFTGVVAAGVQGGLIRPLSKRIDDARLIQVGVVVQAIAFALLAITPRLGVGALLGACALLAFGNGLSQPSVSAYISKRAPATEQGSTLGTNQAIAALARMVGPGLGGWLYGHVGHLSPYVTAAAGMCVAAALGLTLQRSPQTRSTSTQTS